MPCNKYIFLVLSGLLINNPAQIFAQKGKYDTIRLGAIEEKGIVYAMILLPELTLTGKMMDNEEIRRISRLRTNVFKVYPYATAAATIINEIDDRLDHLADRKARKKYLKSMDKTLDETFNAPLKNLSIEQGHILVKLVNRQTGKNCFSIIKEYKNIFTALMWQSVGIAFKNNLIHKYDPKGDDIELENIVSELEASNLYRYELYQQQVLLSKVKK